MQWIDFPPPAEFCDRTGTVRAIATCSVIGRFEFNERLEQIQQRLATAEVGESWQKVYDRDKRLRHHVNRCLQLNGINPDWTTLDMIEAFLFHRFDEETGEYIPGWLVELNSPKETAPSSIPNQRPYTMAEVIAALSLQTGISDALQSASTMPAETLSEIGHARSQMMKNAQDGKPANAPPKPSRDEFLAMINQ